MTFSRLRAGGFGANTTVTSSEFTQLDIDHANAPDKTNGDTIGNACTWIWPHGSHCTFQGAELKLDTNGVFASSLNLPSCTTTYSGSSQCLFTSTTSMAFSGTSTCSFATGTTLTIATGATMSVNAGGTLSCAGALTMASGGAATIASGATVTFMDQYPALANTHPGQTQNVLVQFGMVPFGGWQNTINGVVATLAPPVTAGNPGTLLLNPPWNGATLNTIKVRFTPSGSTGRSGSLPASAMTVVLQRRKIDAGVALPVWTSVATATYVPVSFADYTNGNVKELTVSPAHVFDRTQYEYSLQITDENGANSRGDTVYHGAVFSHTITDLRPA